jgi:hypothetical protein
LEPSSFTAANHYPWHWTHGTQNTAGMRNVSLSQPCR